MSKPERMMPYECDCGDGPHNPGCEFSVRHSEAQQAEELRQKDAEIQRLQREVHAGNVALDTANETVTRLRAELAERDGAVDEALRREDALRAELARLQPSGQVAEDVDSVRGLLSELRAHRMVQGWHVAIDGSLPRLSRLATGAQAAQEKDRRAILAVQAAYDTTNLIWCDAVRAKQVADDVAAALGMDP
jgi:DNA repair exonuclease SbcCD ATPase subunit